MKLHKLNKEVLSVTPKPESFLPGICSNVLDKPRNAFLDIHGRIVATFDQLKVSEKKYLIVIEKDFLGTLMQHLDKFIRISGARVVPEDYKVFFDLEGSYKKEDSEFTVAQKKGQLVVTTKDLPAAVIGEEFTIFRLKNNIPVHGIDYRDEMVLNVGEDEFVSYTKGCFLGQEFVAKVHNRSKSTWKLVVKGEEGLSEEERKKMTSRAFDPVSKKTLGFIFAANR